VIGVPPNSRRADDAVRLRATAARPLGSLRVVDLTQLRAGPYCTRLLAGFGAQVIKVERPGKGDVLRDHGPFVGGRAGRERSIPFHWLNLGKKSVTLDLEASEGRELLWRLIRTADVLVESFAPRVKRRLGLTYDAARAANPRLVMTSISSFGESGPYRDYRANETVLYAMSGGMYTTGDADRAPLAARPAMTQFTAGMHAYIGTLMALFRRGPSGPGEHVEVSMQESALENVEIQLAEYLHEGKVARRKGNEHPLVPWRTYPCRDGYAAVIGGPLRHWAKAAEMFEDPRLLEPKLRQAAGRIEHRAEVESLLRPWLARHGKKDVYHMGQARGLAFGYVADLKDALESPQHRARGFFVDTDEHPEVGRLRVCGAPFLVRGADWTVGRAPLLGEHTAEVLTGCLGLSDDGIATLRERNVL